jgi:hypothetical protein
MIKDMKRTLLMGAWLLTACGGAGETDTTVEGSSTAEPMATVGDLFAADGCGGQCTRQSDRLHVPAPVARSEHDTDLRSDAGPTCVA